LKITFKDKKLRDLCETRTVAERKLGSACARKLASRLFELSAARRVSELVAGHPHPLKGNRTGQFALELTGGWRLVFAPGAMPVPMTGEGAVD
jgi:proteic killer suppression protein